MISRMTSYNILNLGVTQKTRNRVSAKNHFGSAYLVKRFLILVVLLVLQACASTGANRAPTQAPAEVEERAVVDGHVLPLPEERVIRSEPLPGAPSESVVAKRLLASANGYMDQGDTQSAVGSLERALRIEPRNAVLWSRLAEVRFEQQNWQQAIQMAAKSNTLAPANSALRRQNWNLMASAYTALGQDDQAEKFRAKLRGE